MNEIAKLILFGVNYVVCFVAFTKAKSTAAFFVMLIGFLINMVLFYKEYFVNFAGG